MTTVVRKFDEAQEQTITHKELQSAALKGRYYRYEKHAWEEMGWVEGLLRILFGCFMDSIQTTCLRHSWTAIAKMPSIPIDFKNHIEDLFLDSLYRTNPSYASAGVISRIFCRTLQENASTSGRPLSQLNVQQHPTDRSFGVFYNQELRYAVANSQYGTLAFYNPQNQQVAINQYDSLWDMRQRIGGIKLPAMQLYSGADLPLVKIEDIRDKTTLVFREIATNQILAVSNLSTADGLINWATTLIHPNLFNQQQLTPLLLAWAILKYSQHHHFPSSDKPKYVIHLPQTQNFRVIESQ